MTEKQIVDSFLNDKEFQAMVEKEIGKVVKVQVNWETRKVSIQSRKTGRELDVDAIIAAYDGSLNQ